MSGLIIDISSNNHDPDFKKVARDGIAGVLIKATEGTSYINPRLKPTYLAAKQAGLRVGTYHFGREDTHPGAAGAVAEADHYLATMRMLPGPHLWDKGDFLPILDFEKGTGDHRYSPWRDAFLGRVRGVTGHYGMLYTSPGFNNWTRPKSGLDRLWVAHYTTASHPMQVPGYTGWDLWQFTDRDHQVNGCYEPVDASKVGPKGLARIVCHNAG